MPNRRHWRYKETEEQKCKRKLRHTDYLSALLHAKSLGVEPIDIYPCDLCGGLHLGHTTLKYAAHCEREREAKINHLLRRIRKHENLAAQHAAIAQGLRQELEAVMTP